MHGPQQVLLISNQTRRMCDNWSGPHYSVRVATLTKACGKKRYYPEMGLLKLFCYPNTVSTIKF